ncbi:MAG TPA: hypothetical protein VGL66_19295 [Caulobacteraceae bacterium]|jgi:hypothetical protein
MPAMTDPHDALVSFQQALAEGALQLRPGELDLTLLLHVDHPNNVLRLTYVHTEGTTVTALAMFAQVEPYEGLPCFQVGYAVPDACRGKGRAKAVLKAAIAEMEHGFARTPLKRFYVEAVVGVDNAPSRKIAEAVFEQTGTEITDEVSDQPAIHFVKEFGVSTKHST